MNAKTILIPQALASVVQEATKPHEPAAEAPWAAEQYYGRPPSQRPSGPMPRYASWGARVGATVLDFLIVLIFLIPAIVGSVLAAGDNSVLVVFGAMLAAVGWLGLVIFQIWDYCVRQGRTGATIGKRLVGIQLVSETTGRPPGGLVCFARMFVHVIDVYLYFLGFLWPLWDKKNQTWTDKVLRTIVVERANAPAVDHNAAAIEDVRALRKKRSEALALVERDPQMARDLRIGRPDLPRHYDDGGLVDLNSVSAEVMAEWLPLSAMQAAQVVERRQKLGKLEHVDLMNLLEPNVYDRLSDLVVFL